jgi:prepilin-type N-terminal cleavage/methylation domain-containing protein
LIRRRLNEESGYSMIEVMVSIMILAIAIIPMVGMFDMGLNHARTGSNYDKARTLANTKLEQAKMLDYETVRTTFPSQATSGNVAPSGSNNSITSSPVTSGSGPGRDPRVPQGLSYVVTKQYLQQPPNDDLDGEDIFRPSPDGATDTGLLKITVRVSWSGNSYQTSGVVAL